MCFFGSSGSSASTSTDATTSAKDEKDTAVKKARLLGTEGANKGAELSAQQGQSVRRVFGG